MANRWGAPEGPITPPPYNTNIDDEPRGEGAVPPAAVESWRTWLLTGKSGVVSDRRRVRGSHRGLKQMLVDGTGRDMPQSWKHFSGAMVRLAINDALNALPPDQTNVVWLAYFGGLSNSEIAKRLGLSLGGVQRRLKLAFEQLGDYVEHGRAAGRRAVYAIAGWLSLRRLVDSHPMLLQSVAAAGATAVVIVGAAGSSIVQTPAATPHSIPRVAPSPHASMPNAPTSGIDSAAQAVTSTVEVKVGSVKQTVNAIPVPSPPPVVPPLPSPPPLPTPPPV